MPLVQARINPRLPFSFARHNGVLLLNDVNGRHTLLYRNDTKHRALMEAQRFVAEEFELKEIDSETFERELQQCYEEADNQAEQAISDINDDLDLKQVAEQLAEPTDLLESADDAPIIRLINALLAEAIRSNASDIHIDVYENRLTIRMRVDGVMREMLSPPRSLANLIISRIKIMAKLDISEKRLPMDGRISLRIANRPVDVRVSTMPSGQSERIVLRLLDKQAGRLKLEEIGMAKPIVANIEELISKPHGIILVTGPTGSGKTTTLYAALSRLNSRERNIMTIEDPIEYDLDGIAQSQVNGKVDFSFSRGLRAILRQDPDVVMVGEIRDLDTVQIAIQASLTGHLVLSTLHTNSAVGAITRLQDMGTEPFLLSSSLIGVLAQRLLRTLCNDCKEAHQPDAKEAELLELTSADTEIYRAVGCAACGQTGYRGRTSIHELVVIDEEIRRLIHDNAAQHEIESLVFSRTHNLRQSGYQKVLAGITSMEEVIRVTSDS